MTAQPPDAPRIAALVKTAKAAVAHEQDPDLRRVAFDRILQHLLEGAATPEDSRRPRKTTQKRKGRRKPAAQPKRASRARRESAGPKKWLEELIDEGFFKDPRPTTAMIAALAERGHHVKRTDLTRQLITLVNERKLRRKKMRAGDDGKQIWHYSNW